MATLPAHADLFDVVEALLAALESYDHRIGDHASGKLHDRIVVGGREQYHLARLGQLPARGQFEVI